MREELKRDSHTDPRRSHIALTQRVLLGLVGGLAGTLVMDLVLFGLFSALGMPADLTFSFIGDTAAGFFFMIGISTIGGTPLGVIVHYLIGLTLGVIFGVVVPQVQAMRAATLKKGALVGIIYIEVISQPILVTAPIINNMTTAGTMQWFGLSFFMHLICGAVLGLVVTYGLRRIGRGERGQILTA